MINRYVFEMQTEGTGDDELLQVDEIVIFDVTPHEAWVRMGTVLAELPEHDRVILSVRLRD